ncbi:MAG: hypothetical protein NTX79_05370 [Candidatus Micrarchaeota archaeon]|nr:hypothetical protein [Candidatus Micrarchaeota archaeon]
MASATKTRQAAPDLSDEQIEKLNSSILGFTVPTISLPAKPQQQEKTCPVREDKRLFQIEYDRDDKQGYERSLIEKAKEHGLKFAKSDIRGEKYYSGELTDSEGKQYSLSIHDSYLYEVLTLKDFQKLLSENKYVVVTDGSPTCTPCVAAKEAVDKMRNDPRLVQLGIAFVKTTAVSPLEDMFHKAQIGYEKVGIYDQSGRLLGLFDIIKDKKDPAGALLKAIEAYEQKN